MGTLPFGFRITALFLLTLLLPGIFVHAENSSPGTLRETVRGIYYYEDQGLFTVLDGNRVYSEQYHDGRAIDFGGRIVFTFDDVVFDASLDHILDALAERRIRAVFFLSGTHMAGVNVREITPRLERMIADGHEIGNHGFHHDQFDRGIYADGHHDSRDISEDLDLLESLIDEALGYHYAVRSVRPPFGIRGNNSAGAEERMAREGTVDRVVAERGQDLVLWHINSLDFLVVPGGRYSPQDLPQLAAQRVAESLGGVILFHSNGFTASVIDETIDAILATRTRVGDPVHPVELAQIYRIKYRPDRYLMQVR